MLKAALDGDLNNVEYSIDPIFRFHVPTKCPGVPDNVLVPSKSWPSEEAYLKKYRSLALRFIDNFKKYAGGCSKEVIDAGPVV